jgi:predicted lipopolysaccharide heptosyltransferase III
MKVGPFHSITRALRNILVVQLGDIGDVVWTTPTLWALREAWPEARLSILLRAGSGCLLQADPSLHEIFEVHQAGIGQILLVRELRGRHFDVVFDLRADDRGAIMARLTGAPVRIAQYYPAGLPFWRNRLFTHLVNPAPPRKRILGAAEQSLRIIRGVGIEAKDTRPRLWIMEQVRNRTGVILEKAGVPQPGGEATDGRWISLNPFSRWLYKEWPAERWIEIIGWLRESYGLTAVIVGSEAERLRAAGIAEACGGAAHNLAGCTTLSELACLLSFSRLHIGVDSAAPHIAAAVGTPTVTVYGPSDWRDWAPVGDGHCVVVPDMICVPCRNKGCDGSGESRCLETLGVDKVKEAILDALKGTF